ncbi:MAG: hypothetical protein ABMA14_07415 [Hyphomonadaceae bacterium]
MTRKRNTEAGFSLLETLLGLTLTAIIGMLMMGSMQMGTRVWERQRSSMQPGTEQLMLSQVSEWLAQAMQDKVRNYDTPVYAPFRGDEYALSFLHATPGLGDAPGVYTIKLELTEAEDCANGRDLYLDMSRDIVSDKLEAPVDAPSERRRLIKCIETPSFIFWGDHANAGQKAWFSSWIDEPQLPGVVRLRSISADGVERAVLTQDILLTAH